MNNQLCYKLHFKLHWRIPDPLCRKGVPLYSGNRKVFIDNTVGNGSLTFSEMKRRAHKIPVCPHHLKEERVDQ